MILLKEIEKIRKFNRYYANLLGKIDQEIYNQSYPLTEARVITEINSNDGCTATEVRETLGIDKGQMSRILQRFEEKNIVIKRQSSEDKRQYLPYLTNYGKRIYNDLVENANREVGKMIEDVPKPILSKLITSMETIQHIFSREYSSTSKVLIRTFESGDVGYVAHLHGRIYKETYKFGRMFEYYVMKGLTEFIINTDGGELWIAEVDGEIVGSIAITKSSDTVAQLRWSVLDNNYQGMDIGNKLMETAINFCKKQDYQRIFLWTVNILGAARHLYQKYNFKLAEEKPNEDWTETLIMEERWDLDLSDEK